MQSAKRDLKETGALVPGNPSVLAGQTTVVGHLGPSENVYCCHLPLFLSVNKQYHWVVKFSPEDTQGMQI